MWRKVCWILAQRFWAVLCVGCKQAFKCQHKKMSLHKVVTASEELFYSSAMSLKAAWRNLWGTFFFIVCILPKQPVSFINGTNVDVGRGKPFRINRINNVLNLGKLYCICIKRSLMPNNLTENNMWHNYSFSYYCNVAWAFLYKNHILFLMTVTITMSLKALLTCKIETFGKMETVFLPQYQDHTKGMNM